MPDTIIIEFKADASQLLTTVEIMKSLHLITDEQADSFAAMGVAAKKANDDVSNASVAANNATGSLEEMNSGLTDIANTIKAGAANTLATDIAKIAPKASEANVSVRKLKQALEEAEEEYGKNSAQAKKAESALLSFATAQRSVSLELKELTKAGSTADRTMGFITHTTMGTMQAYGALSMAMAGEGEDHEKAEKAMMKSMEIMQLMGALTELMSVKREIQGVKSVIVSNMIKAGYLEEGAAATIANIATGALSAATSPIGIIVTVVAAAVGYLATTYRAWSKQSEEVSKSLEVQAEAIKTEGEQIKVHAEIAKAAAEGELKLLEATKSAYGDIIAKKKDIVELDKNALEAQLKNEEEALKIATLQANNSSDYIKGKEKQEEADKKATKLGALINADLMTLPQGLQVVRSKFDELRTEIANIEDYQKYKKQLEDIELTITKTKAALKEKPTDTQLINVESLEKQKEVNERVAKLRADGINDAREKELKQLDVAQEQNLKHLSNQAKDTSALRLALEEDFQRKKKEINYKYDQEALKTNNEIAVVMAKTDEDRYQANLNKITSERDLDLKNIKLTEDQKKLIIAKATDDIKKLYNEHYAKITEMRAANADDEISQAKWEQKEKEDVATAGAEIQTIQAKGFIQKELDAKINALKVERDIELDNNERTAQSWEALEKKKQAITMKYAKLIEESQVQAAQKTVERIGGMLNQLGEALLQSSKNELDRKMDAYDAQMAKLDDLHNKETSNANLTAEQKKRIDADYAASKKKIQDQETKAKKEAAEEERRIKMGEAAIEIASTILKLGADLGVAAPPFQVAAAVLGAIQLANIAGAKFAKGTTFVEGPGTGTSDSIPAWLSRGEAIVPADKNAKYAPLVKGIIADNVDLTFGKYLGDYQNHELDSIALDKAIFALNMQHAGIDYDLLTDKLSEKLGNRFDSSIKKIPEVKTIFDEHGFTEFVKTQASKRTYKNGRFKS